MHFFAFFRHFRFGMGVVWVCGWNRLEILILKHTWKGGIWLLEQRWDKGRYDAFFLVHPVHKYTNTQIQIHTSSPIQSNNSTEPDIASGFSGRCSHQLSLILDSCTQIHKCKYKYILSNNSKEPDIASGFSGRGSHQLKLCCSLLLLMY